MLHTLTKPLWNKSKALRRWRWNSSGRWNYCGRGLKGQKARSWGSLPAWFEWGQTPLAQRLPKLRWFKRYYKLVDDVCVINVWSLELHPWVSSGDVIDVQKCIDLWYITKPQTIKILWWWDVSKSLTISWCKISTSAQSKIEAAWGSIA